MKIKRISVWGLLVGIVAYGLYTMLTVVIIFDWVSPDRETSIFKLSVVSAMLVLGWYYLLSKTALKRHVALVRKVVRR